MEKETIREILNEWFKTQPRITTEDNRKMGFMITKNQAIKLKEKLWKSDKPKIEIIKAQQMWEELKRRNFQYGELSNKYASLKYELEKLKIKPIVTTNHNKDDIIIHTDYDKEKKIYRVDVKLKENTHDTKNVINYNDFKSARQCMNLKLLRCDNKGCLNLVCPLNKIYDSNQNRPKAIGTAQDSTLQRESNRPKEHKKGGITITDVKLVGLCSKCRTKDDEVLKWIDGTIVPDEDIACINEALGNNCEDKTPKAIVDNLNNERVATLKKKGCGKVLSLNSAYDGKIVKCGEYGDIICSECLQKNKLTKHLKQAKQRIDNGEFVTEEEFFKSEKSVSCRKEYYDKDLQALMICGERDGILCPACLKLKNAYQSKGVTK